MPSIFYNYLTKLPSLTVSTPPQQITTSDGIECIDTSILRTYRLLEDIITLITESIYRRIFSIESTLANELIVLTTQQIRSDTLFSSESLISPKYYSRPDTITTIERIPYRELSRPEASSTIERISQRRYVLLELAESLDVVVSPPTSFVFSDEQYSIDEIVSVKEMKNIRDFNYVLSDIVYQRDLVIIEYLSTLERVIKTMYQFETIDYFEIANPIRCVFEYINTFDILSQKHLSNYRDYVYTLDVFGNVRFIRQDQIYYLYELKSILSTNIVYDILDANEYFAYSRTFSLDYIYTIELITSRFIELFDSLIISSISSIFLRSLDDCLIDEFSNVIIKSFEEAIFEEVISNRAYLLIDITTLSEYLEYSYRVFIDEIMSSDGLIFEYIDDVLLVKGKAILDGVIALTTPYLGECIISSKANIIVHGSVDDINESPIIDNEILTTMIIDSTYNTINRIGELRSSDAIIKDYVMQKTTFMRGETINAIFKPIFFANIELLPYTISNIQTNPYKFVKDSASVSDNVISLEV